MNRDAAAAQLFAIRAQVDALLMQLEPAQDEPKECPHPPQARRDLSVMGSAERWHCQLCGFDYDGADAEEEPR